MKSSTAIIIAIATAALTYFAYNHYQTPSQSIDPKILVISLMVKNEEPAMALTLQPLIDAGITQYFIYDTGSTDNTIAITKKIFEDNKIKNFVIEQGPWIDFAASRNAALKLTEKYFPQATFILMLDAEWILHNGADLLNFCNFEKNTKNTVYSIFMVSNDIVLNHDRLFRSKSNVCFTGKVHEWPNIPSQIPIPKNIYFQLTQSRIGKQKTENRFLKDRDILLSEITQYPENKHAMAALAQTYFLLKDYTNAIKWYEKLLSFSDLQDINVFYNTFYLAMSYEKIKKIDKAILTYLQAYQIRPCRAEPLIKLAGLYYMQKDFYLAFLFAKHAVTIPCPTNEKDAVEKYWYDFVRYHLLSSTAYLFQEYQLGLQATLKALQQEPHDQYLQEQLQYYESIISKH